MKRHLMVLYVAAGLAAFPGGAIAQEAGTTKPDNTKVNKRDRDKSAVTAGDQKENKSDRETARQIRRAIVQDKTLSTYAHNVKVIVQNGTVTLKGPVRSEEEKRAVEAKASSVAGAATITNELSVTGDTADRAKPEKH